MTQTYSLATAREAREYLRELQSRQPLPNGIRVGERGRLSQAAKDLFFEHTGKIVISPDTE